MAALSGDLRGQLERSIVAAREESERAARAALETLGVVRREAFPGISDEDRQLRVQLRMRARQLGEGTFEAGIEPLVEEIAYEGWHRMLFARFLAENDLLMHPFGVAVTLEECAELAREEGEADAWMVAAHYASAMLPGIFRQDDPSARVRFAPEGRNALERILNELLPAVFQADDALGWVYQFWQSRAKKAVNDSGVKIGAKELPAVTQLFTEDYMVRFLLENSLGAWWASLHPESPLIKEWKYLRLLEDGTPAAGRFEGWPDRTAEVTVMDPCCGSGHFLVAAFDMLQKLRIEEEGLSERDAGEAVLRDNVHGLEIDARCTQIAAFALAFAAWKAGGYRELPLLSVACSGTAVQEQLANWTRLSGDNVNLSMTLERLHTLFREAPVLGSLINPADASEPLFTPDYAKIEPVLERVLAREQAAEDPVARLFGVTAQGMVRTARLLKDTYTLVATNVPYLARGKQADVLARFSMARYPEAKADLATVFVERCRSLTELGGTYAIVTPQNWLFQGSYTDVRSRVLREWQWNLLARLGPGAFQTISGEVVKPILTVSTAFPPSSTHEIRLIDVTQIPTPAGKASALCEAVVHNTKQRSQLLNPDARVTGGDFSGSELLSRYAHGVHGLGTKDSPRFIRCFWEVRELAPDWEFIQSTVTERMPWGGAEHIVFWERGHGILHDLGRRGWAILAGGMAWGKPGVCISQMGSLPASLFTGQIFDKNAAVILPRDPDLLPAIWAFCSSPQYSALVREIDPKMNVTNATLVKVPFDRDYWEKVAGATPLPGPYSNDPTQWLSKGDPADSTDPLQVAVARLVGYRWPEQERDRFEAQADEDGNVPLVPILNEQPAAERLRALLAAAFGDAWSTHKQDALLSQVGYGGKDLSTWLRDGYFQQHGKLFHHRPFIWHIWDGTRDGFSALVNYHKLDTSALERLIYTYLGAWIDRQRGERDADVTGAEGRLVAALNLQQKLIAIREGEPPYDIYVRWKPKHEQPIGWDPDLNDGVRLNIRPFVEAGVLRNKFTVNWNKDRGTNPDGSERLNDLHLTLAEKRVARAEAGVA